MAALQIPGALFLPTAVLGTLMTNAAAGANVWYDSATSTSAVATVAKATAGTLYGAYLDNSANNSTTPAYLKIAFTTTGPTVGTTIPDLSLEIAGGAVQTFPLPSGTGGTTFGTALSYWTVTAGGTTSTALPTAATIVALAYL